jgi:hypothetical protein
MIKKKTFGNNMNMYILDASYKPILIKKERDNFTVIAENMQEIQKYLQLQYQNINTLILITGPGNFSSLRWSIAFVKGLFFNTKTVIYAISFFDIIQNNQNLFQKSKIRIFFYGSYHLPYIQENNHQKLNFIQNPVIQLQEGYEEFFFQHYLYSPIKENILVISFEMIVAAAKNPVAVMEIDGVFVDIWNKWHNK